MLNFRPHKLQVKLSTGGGFDEKRNPIPVTEAWSDKIPCRFETDTRETVKWTDAGPVRIYNYVVWMDPQDGMDFSNKFVRLIDQNDNVIAELPVQKPVPGQLRTKLFL